MKVLIQGLFVLLAVTGGVLAQGDDDLGIRFSKVTFSNELLAPDNPDLPLTSDHYPLTLDTFRWLRYSDVYSIIIPEACVGCHYNSSELVDSIGGLPTHPSSDPDSPFWLELHHVVLMQHLRRDNVDPHSIMPLPKLWDGMTIAEVAAAVHNEYPALHHTALITHMAETQTLPHYDYSVVPFSCLVEFLRGAVMLADLATWSIGRVGPMNFGVKYYAGRARPEEVAFQIAQGDISPDFLPQILLTDIRTLQLQSPESFTAYPEGSPKHPSWPAMHSAGSAMSLWFPVVVQDISDELLCQVKLTDYAVSYARTVAGVHYVSDNIAGLNLGQEIVARMLPDYLHENYGSSKQRVLDKIEAARFDWNDFLDSDCAKQGMAMA